MRLKRLWWLLLLLPLLAVAAFVIWAETGPKPTSQALAALNSDSLVEVSENGWLVFNPVRQSPATGLILYPGARIDPRAYAPAARALAEAGYLVVIPSMPLNLAFLSPGEASQIMEAYPEIERWAVGGHSLGGAMAANFAAANPDAVQGLVLWAAYPAGSDDLSTREMATVAVFATEDGLVSAEEIEAAHALLPSDTNWVTIEGGNHAQFGRYGSQAGDNPAAISPEDQQNAIVAATLELLGKIAP